MPSTQVSWNYQHAGLPSRAGSTVGPYPTMSAPTTYATTSIAPHSYPSSASYARLQPLGGQAPSAYNNNSRQSFSGNHAWLPEDITDPYSLSSSQYTVPAQESQLPSLNYTSSEMSRDWMPIPGTRQTQQGYHMDQEGPSKYATSSCSLPSNALMACTTGAPEGNSQFPAMNTLKSTLPSYSLHGSRILPVPESKRGSTSKNHLNASLFAAEDTATGLSQSLNYRPGLLWNPEHTVPEGNQHSAGSSTSSAASGTEGVSSNSSSSPQMSQKATSFGYRQAHQDRGSDFNPTYNMSSTASMKRHTGIDTTGFPNEVSSDSILPSQDSSQSQYTYSLGNSAEDPKGTLVNGQSYTRIQEPQHAESYETLNHFPGQTSTYQNHRTSTNLRS